jgi:uncharacterized protein (TIGR03437 family)
MPRLFTGVLLALIISWAASGQTYTISTFAGGGLPVNVKGTSASLYGPNGVAVDKAGNVFFADGNCVLRLDAVTGVLTVVAGNGIPGFSGDNGLATSAELNYPGGVVIDAVGTLYIADTYNYVVRKVTNGVITTVAGNGKFGFAGDGGFAINAQLEFPQGVAVDAAGNLYIADSGNNRIRKISGGVISTFAGGGTSLGDNGPATSAELGWPSGVALDTAGNLYIADTDADRIRKVTNGVITTVAGGATCVNLMSCGFAGDGGPATSAQLLSPTGIAVDSAGDLYIADTENSAIRKVSGGVITTITGDGSFGFSGDNGPAADAELQEPFGIALDSAGNLYISDTGDFRIRKISNGVITTMAGNGTQGFSGDNGPATNAELELPGGVAADSAGNVYIADSDNQRVRKVSNGVIATVMASGNFGGFVGWPSSGPLYTPAGVAVDSADNLYVADSYDHVVCKVTNGVIATVAGNGDYGSGGDGGPATSAQLGLPQGIAVDSAGNLYIADDPGVRKVSNGVITTVAGGGTSLGDDVPATSAQIGANVIAVDSAGSLYIADTYGNVVRKVSKSMITTVAGNGTAGFSGDGGPATSAQLSYPVGIAVDSGGNLYIADNGNSRIRKVSNGVITTVAGNGEFGFSGDGGPATEAGLPGPQGIAVDSAGHVYIADGNNNRIRLLTPGTAPTIAPSAAPVQPGSWVSIYGTNLASGTSLWNGDFPQSLGGTTVAIDKRPAYLWYVSPTQINLQVPDDTSTGPVNILVTTASGTASSTVTLAPYAPSFSLLGDGKHAAAEIATPIGTGAYGGGTYDLAGPSNTFSYNTRPVMAGETLILYGVGFGPTSPNVPAGKAFSSAAPTNSPVTVTIGGVPARVAFSGITSAGLYQINLTVPAGIGSGDQALVATVNGVQTAGGPVVAVQ